MSIITKLYIDDKEFIILDYNLDINTKTDSVGKPCSVASGGMWNITIETTKDTLFYEWATSPTMMKEVKIVQSPVALNGKSKTFDLYDVFCVAHRIRFNAVNAIPMLTHITITPAIMVVDGEVIFEKHWKVSNIHNSDVEPTVLEQEEPEIISYHIQDEHNHKLTKDEIEVGDEITLVVESKNAVGETLEVDLDDNRLDYESNGKKLKNDILNLVIEDDITYVPLTAIAQEH